jgi:solute:Na+ symporter, SSS family
VNPHLVLLAAYSLVLVLVGLWIGRFVRHAGDFFVAGRRLGAGLLFSTVLAANIGAGSTVGATSLGYRDGLSAWWWNGSAGIGSLVLALWVGPRIWSLASRHGFYTVGDFLEHRFGRSVRAVITTVIALGALWILAGQLIGVASILNEVAGLPRLAGAVTGGAVITAYFVAGGLWSSAWVNVIQLTVKLAGFAVAVPWVLSRAGWWSGLVSASAAGPGYGDFWFSRGTGSGWQLIALLAPAFIVSPGLLQKIYGAKNVRAVRRGIGANAGALMAFGFAPALLGMAARARFPELGDINLALPTILVHALPPLLGSLALAAVFSAEISAADAVLFMFSTSLSQDLYRRFVRPDADEQRVLLVARWAAAAGGALGVGLAVLVPTVVAALSVFYALLGVSLFVPLIAGLYTERPGTKEALASIGAGIAAWLWAQFAVAGQVLGPITPNLFGILMAGAVFGAVWALRAARLVK